MAAVLRPAQLQAWIDSCGVRPQLDQYCALLQAVGATTNLIGTLEPERIWDELLLDAVASYQLVPAEVRRVADIGSGAGLPGLVWALLARAQGRPLSVTLIEPRAKRVEFLQRAVDTLGLGAAVSCIKATVGGYRERHYRPDHGFDLVTSRAVFPLAEVVESQQPISGRYQLLHVSAADLDNWQVPASWCRADHARYEPAGARPRSYLLLQRV